LDVVLKEPQAKPPSFWITNREAILTAAIKVVPMVFALFLVVWLVCRYDDVVRKVLIPHISGIEVFGVKLDLAEQSLDDMRKPAPVLDPTEPPRQMPLLSAEVKAQISARVRLISPALQGRRILWVDDHPAGNISERNFLQSIGIFVDSAESNATAYLLMKGQKFYGTPYDLVISDVDRNNEQKESGFTLLKGMRDRGYQTDVIYYTAYLRPMPEGASALTNYSGDLLNYVFDVLERRGASSQDERKLISPATR
jgi:CheY-like chemotaxis protein